MNEEARERLAALDIDQKLPVPGPDLTLREHKEHFYAMQARLLSPAYKARVYDRISIWCEQTEIHLLNYRRFIAGGRNWSIDDMSKKTKTTAKPIILRKMRPVDIMGRPVKFFVPQEEGGMVKLYTVYGKARAIRAGTSTYGEFHALKGMFQSVRESDNQEFISAECFLPEPVHDHVVNHFLAAKEKGKDADMLEFAFEVHLKESKMPIGYEYVTVPIVQPSATDDLADLRAKALEGPGDDVEGISSVQMGLGGTV